MNLCHHRYFVFILVVACGQWLTCEATPDKEQSKDVHSKVDKRFYSDYGVGLDYLDQDTSDSDDSNLVISYNLAGNIKFKLGSSKHKKPQSYFPYWLLNFWPTTESEPAASCPSYIPSPICARPDSCQSDSECNFQEVCCLTEDWIGYTCCVSIVETTTEAEPDIYNLCPNSNPNLACQREESCSSYTDCFSNETCCQIQELIAAGEPPCCVLNPDLDYTTEDITETTTETETIFEFTTATDTVSEVSEIIIPDTSCPNSDGYNPAVCYHCSSTTQAAVCLDTESCCFSTIRGSRCCYNNATIISTTETPTTTTTTETSVPSTVFIKKCVIPPGVSHYYWPTNCVSSSECPTATECCNGFAGAGCYDWPTRVPEPGSSCPRGYKTCVIQPGIEGAVGIPKTCSNDDYNTVCSESEYCCKINNSSSACCVEKNTDLVWPER